MKTIPFLLLFPFFMVPTVGLAAEGTWPQWRGVHRTGEVEGTNWPATLDGLSELWFAELDKGYPGPIVSADKVFTVETRNRKEEVVRAFDRESGDELWQVAWKGSMKVPFFANANGSWVRSTPALDDGKLYVGGMQDVLVCIDTAKGEELWRVDFKQRHKSKQPSFGMVCSPLVVGDHLYVQAGGGFCKLDKATGESVWRCLDDGGGMFGSAFSSPVWARVGGKDQLVVQTRTILAGVNPETGKMEWGQKIEAFRGMNILTPVVLDDGRVFTSTYQGGSFLVQVEEEISFAWRNKREGYMSTPVRIGNHVYQHLRNERFVCVDLKTGEAAWTSPRAMGKYMSLAFQRSSPSPRPGQGATPPSSDKIIALNERGLLRLFEATPDEMKLLSEKKVSEDQTWGHIAVAGNQLFVRELSGIRAWSLK